MTGRPANADFVTVGGADRPEVSCRFGEETGRWIHGGIAIRIRYDTILQSIFFQIAGPVNIGLRLEDRHVQVI